MMLFKWWEKYKDNLFKELCDVALVGQPSDIQKLRMLSLKIGVNHLNKRVVGLIKEGKFSPVLNIELLLGVRDAIGQALHDFTVQQWLAHLRDKSFLSMLCEVYKYDNIDSTVRQFSDQENKAIVYELWQSCPMMDGYGGRHGVDWFEILLRIFPQKDFLPEVLMEICPEHIICGGKYWHITPQAYTPEQVYQGYCNIQQQGLWTFAYKQKNYYCEFLRYNFFGGDTEPEESLRQYVAFANSFKDSDPMFYSMVSCVEVYRDVCHGNSEDWHDFFLDNFDLSTILKGLKQHMQACINKNSQNTQHDCGIVHSTMEDMLRSLCGALSTSPAGPRALAASEEVLAFLLENSIPFLLHYSINGRPLGVIEHIDLHLLKNIGKYCNSPSVKSLLMPARFNEYRSFNPEEEEQERWLLNVLRFMLHHAIEHKLNDVTGVFQRVITGQEPCDYKKSSMMNEFIEKNKQSFQAILQAYWLEQDLPRHNRSTPKKTKL